MPSNTQTAPKKTILLCSPAEGQAEKLSAAIAELNIELHHVPSANYRHSVKSELGIGKTKITPPEYTEGDFSEPVMIMYGLSRKELDFVLEAMREKLISVQLKAVVTKVNINWNFLQFYNALRRERDSFKSR